MKMMQREPTHPSLFLEEDYLKPLGLSHDKAAKLLGIEEVTLEAFVHKELPVSKELAMCLEHLFNTEWEFWMNTQKTYDRWIENQMH